MDKNAISCVTLTDQYRQPAQNKHVFFWGFFFPSGLIGEECQIEPEHQRVGGFSDYVREEYDLFPRKSSQPSVRLARRENKSSDMIFCSPLAFDRWRIVFKWESPSAKRPLTTSPIMHVDDRSHKEKNHEPQKQCWVKEEKNWRRSPKKSKRGIECAHVKCDDICVHGSKSLICNRWRHKKLFCCTE